MEAFDSVVVGAGPAGLAAGVYGVRSGLKTVIVEEKIAGGLSIDAPVIQNYLGFTSVSGMELAQRMVAHAKAAGVQIREFEAVGTIDISDDKKIVRTDKSSYEARAIIVASGCHYRELGVPGEKEFRGRGVSYCGICDGPLFKGKRVLVVGGGNSALMTALYLAERASEVKVVHRRDAFRAEEALVKELRAKEGIEVLLGMEVRQIKGDKLVSGAVLSDNRSGEGRELPVDGVFVQVGEDPNSRFAVDAGIAVDGDGYIKVDMWQRTNVAGVYAAGDVTNHPVKQIGTAVGQGITAALGAYSFVRRPYYKQQKKLQK